jgi:peptide-methionine (S)-S-oxide reductase
MRHIFLATALAAGFLMAPAATSAQAATETAVFAGGCFWCVESDMDHVKGVSETTSGYAGGTKKKPNYEDHDGYTESEKVVFDPSIISYKQLVSHFLRTIDVVDGEGQFCDRGDSYVPAIFVSSDEQKKAATEAVAEAEKALGQKLTVPVRDNANFADAEDYHQNYYLGTNRTLTRFGYVKQSDAYAGYRKGCGRDARVKELWGKAAYTYPDGGMKK